MNHAIRSPPARAFSSALDADARLPTAGNQRPVAARTPPGGGAWPGPSSETRLERAAAAATNPHARRTT